jgi:nicotinate phosphoribosyltransferase
MTFAPCAFKLVIVCSSKSFEAMIFASLKPASSSIRGIGTKLITGYDQPALGAVYKLVAVENNEGEYVDRVI